MKNEINFYDNLCHFNLSEKIDFLSERKNILFHLSFKNSKMDYCNFRTG